MSGISSITSSPLTSSTSSALSTSNLSAVGASLLTTGAAPDPGAPASTSSTSSTGTISSYQAQYQSLQQYDTQELLYASFSLTPEQGLAN